MPLINCEFISAQIVFMYSLLSNFGVQPFRMHRPATKKGIDKSIFYSHLNSNNYDPLLIFFDPTHIQ
jgi:hypothetical protein